MKYELFYLSGAEVKMRLEKQNQSVDKTPLLKIDILK